MQEKRATLSGNAVAFPQQNTSGEQKLKLKDNKVSNQQRINEDYISCSCFIMVLVEHSEQLVYC